MSRARRFLDQKMKIDWFFLLLVLTLISCGVAWFIQRLINQEKSFTILIGFAKSFTLLLVDLLLLGSLLYVLIILNAWLFRFIFYR